MNSKKDLVVKIKRLKENAILPVQKTRHSSGMDLHACIDEPIIIHPGKRASIPTGISIELPTGYESQIRSRSGLSREHGVTVFNGVGTIDGDYRGEYIVLLGNHSDEPFTVEPDMRIAQLVIAKYERICWNEVKKLSKTTRGKGGFGSTGLGDKGLT